MEQEVEHGYVGGTSAPSGPISDWDFSSDASDGNVLQRTKKDEEYTYQDEDFNDEDHVMMNKKEKKANKQRRKVQYHIFLFYSIYIALITAVKETENTLPSIGMAGGDTKTTFPKLF